MLMYKWWVFIMIKNLVLFHVLKLFDWFWLLRHSYVLRYIMNIETSFLDVDLDETECIFPPDGVQVVKGKWCLSTWQGSILHEAAPRAWYKKIDTKLKQMVFPSTINESCLHHRVCKGSLNLIEFYVNDLWMLSLTINNYYALVIRWRT